MFLLSACTHTPMYEYRCPTVKWTNKGTNRSFDIIDETTLKSATKYCASLKNENVCLIRIDRYPNYNYYALCGLKRKFEVKKDGLF